MRVLLIVIEVKKLIKEFKSVTEETEMEEMEKLTSEIEVKPRLLLPHWRNESSKEKRFCYSFQQSMKNSLIDRMFVTRV